VAAEISNRSGMRTLAVLVCAASRALITPARDALRAVQTIAACVKESADCCNVDTSVGISPGTSVCLPEGDVELLCDGGACDLQRSNMIEWNFENIPQRRDCEMVAIGRDGETQDGLIGNFQGGQRRERVEIT